MFFVVAALLSQTFGLSRAAVNNQSLNVHPATACPPSPSPAPTPTPTTGNCVTYHGGLIMTGNVNVYIINWFDNHQPPSNYVSLLQQFYNDLSATQGGQTFYNILNQYPDYTGSYPTGVTLASTWEDDTTPYPTCNPTPCISQIDGTAIQTEVKHAIAQNPSWPQTGSYSNYFVVYTLDGAQSYEGCAFHGASKDNPPFMSGYVQLPSVSVNCPLPSNPPNCGNCDGAISLSAHELFEAAADPQTPAHYPTGWYTTNNTLFPEIGDLCENNYGPTPYPYETGKANQRWVLGSVTHYYLIQEIWSNAVDGCTTGNTG